MASLKQKRMTKQRKLILDILCSTKCHPTAEWIYEEARKTLPDISLGTVYRNLRALHEDNAIQELNYGKSFSRFDANPGRHCHFICSICGGVFDCDKIHMSDLDKLIAKRIPGDIKDYRLEFYGICNDCRNG